MDGIRAAAPLVYDSLKASQRLCLTDKPVDGARERRHLHSDEAQGCEHGCSSACPCGSLDPGQAALVWVTGMHAGVLLSGSPLLRA